MDFKAVFDSEFPKAKEILAQHIDRLVLTPKETEDGMVYDVSGISTYFGGDGKIMSRG
jgi:hypothetical protein